MWRWELKKIDEHAQIIMLLLLRDAEKIIEAKGNTLPRGKRVFFVLKIKTSGANPSNPGEKTNLSEIDLPPGEHRHFACRPKR